MTGKYVTQTLKGHGLVTECVALSGDNKNTSFIGSSCSGNKNVFHCLNYELKKELLSVGCWADILNNSIHHRTDNVCALKIYNYFSIYAVRTKDLKSCCEFVDVDYKQLLSHSKLRWLLPFTVGLWAWNNFLPLTV